MILTIEQVQKQARELALRHLPGQPAGLPAVAIRRTFRRHTESLRAYADELKKVEPSQLQPAEQWLLDHADFIETEAIAIREELTHKQCRNLPRLKPGSEPRIAAVASAYVERVDGVVELDSLIPFMQAYQEVSVLTVAECAAMPMMLRLAVIGRLAAFMEQVRERRLSWAEVDRLLKPFGEGGEKPDASKIKQALEESGQSVPLSAPVVVHLLNRLNEMAEDVSEVRGWLICKLENGMDSLSKLTLYEHQLQASQDWQAGHLIGSLRLIARARWEEVFQKLCAVERTLGIERAGTYPLMEAGSRATLRGQVERLARAYRMPENVIAEQVVSLADAEWDAYKGAISGKREGADEVSGAAAEPSEGGVASPAQEPPALPPRSAYAAYYLLESEGRRVLFRALRSCGKPRSISFRYRMRTDAGAYIGALVGLYAVLMAVALMIVRAAGGITLGTGMWLVVAALLALPVSEWAVNLLHGLIGRIYSGYPPLRYDFSAGVPGDAATMVVIPVIWSSPEEVERIAERLELHYLASMEPQLGYALLGDFPDAATERTKADEAILETAKARIAELNRTYGDAESGKGPFYFFQRGRRWNEAEQTWMGWERKRGKLVEFVDLLRGSTDTSYFLQEGDCRSLNRFRYCLTLDADTELPIGAAQRMIGTIHLPFNRPRLNANGTRVEEGYGVLQPRVGIAFESVAISRLARLWSGKPGIDPYAFAISDPYQNAFGQGIFTGKGIFDIDAFRAVLNERIPDNRVLSHDLLEGGFLRGGLLTDIEVIDGHPATFLSYQKRLHRWVRGDWQLLCWLSPVAANRCGEPEPVDLSLLTRWQIVDNLRRSLVHPALFALLLGGLLFSGGAGAALVAIALLTLGIAVVRTLCSPLRLIQFPKTLAISLGQTAVQLVVLPYQTVIQLDAIIRTLYRLGVSKRKLLEWTSSAEADRVSQGKSPSAIQGAGGGLVLIAVFAAASWFSFPPGLRLTGLALVAGWLLAPLAVRWLNGQPSQRGNVMDEAEREKLGRLAGKIWGYYEDFAGAEDNWLPPDNVQLEQEVGVAHRTSPTNIGLMLACSVSARDFGFIDTPGLVVRAERTLATIERMDKWHGHLYNWYDTRTLNPLPPAYVSTVDSGNFVAYLIALRQGLLEYAEERGLDPVWKERAKDAAAMTDRLVKETNFRPLYDEQAQLFTLGYHVGLERRETILYDLLASEARQASFLAIAFGQAPVTHWFKLGRAMVRADRRPTLLSWSGTMFEYLMPSLLMRTYPDTVWADTYRGVVGKQIEYGRKRGVPFGISESGYYAFDYQMNYQYRAFGVPGLGFQRGLEQDLVLAPYAAIMAIPFRPRESLESLEQMERMGAVGKYGYYEAIDCTASRMPSDQEHMVVRSFMAHHLGMSLLTIGNLLLPRTMIDRFHADKRVQAAELLLQERTPEKPALVRKTAVPAVKRGSEPLIGVRVPLREFTQPSETPEVCVLSNGVYTSVVTDGGGGFSRSGNLAVSRWRQDSVAEAPGHCLYIRDVTAERVWSPSYEPCRTPGEGERAQFALDRAVFMRRDGDISTELEVCVPPDRNAELRRLTLTNTGSEARVIEVTSYVEVALAPRAADDAHPAFSKLFVQTEFEEEQECVLANRRPRDAKEHSKWAVHRLTTGCQSLGPAEFDTDRAAFVGRGHTLARPAGLECRLTGTVGAVLDSAFVMRRRLSIGPGESVKLFAITGVADTREEALEVASLCDDRQVERAFQLAWTHSRIDLRHQHISAQEAADIQRMAARLLYPGPMPEERKESVRACRLGQSGLWPLGISGDLPIALVLMQDMSQMPFANKAMVGYTMLSQKGLPFDLVYLIESAGGYYQDVQQALRQAAELVSAGASWGGGVYVLTADQLPAEQVHLLRAASSLILRANGASFRSQVSARGLRRRRSAAASQRKEGALRTIEGLSSDYRLLPDEAGEERSLLSGDAVGIGVEGEDLQLFNGWGGFSSDGREYRILLRNGKYLPAPWSNVMANREFGCLITELGTGYTWWRNSREFKLTPWSNDPVLDPPGEVCYIRDEDSGSVWSATPAPDLDAAPFDIAHGYGYTRFTRKKGALEQRLTIYVAKEDPAKIVELELENTGSKPRRLSVAYYCNWVLGVNRAASAPYLVSEWDEATHSLLASNAYQETFRDAVGFLHMHVDGQGQSGESWTYTSDRAEFIGRHGTLAAPTGMRAGVLSNTAGVCAEPCGVVRVHITVPAGAKVRVYAVIGAGADREAALATIRQYGSGEQCEAALLHVTAFWDSTLGQTEVRTPNREMNLMLNGWLLYQALSCRMWARTGFYQAGGAYGFRDQLQDSLALLHAAPELTRRQIVLHASHQYEEGDVQHWWHEETGKGIRTRYSDDLLWLPYAVSRYIVHTGDSGILDEQAPFLTSEELSIEEHERYETTVLSGQSASIYEHCVRAIERASRFGQHGLPLMGIGDWNDGMNSVGDEGRGESVWLGWFLRDVLLRFAELCGQQGDSERAEAYRVRADAIREAGNEHAWDGEWYRRAHTDDSTWLGSTVNEECRIDAIAQSWSVISGSAPPDRAKQAMLSFDRELVDRSISVARLLTPPFDRTVPNPGYIQGYPPGIRENGAQYTHGVIWSIVAWCKLGEGDKAVELFHMLNPLTHAQSMAEARNYAGEPYVMAADVYTRDPVKGRAGWTWYTGASGWMYQAGVEWILGIRREGDRLYIRPALPEDWPGYEASYRFGAAVYRITVHQAKRGAEGQKPSETVIVMDGQEQVRQGDAWIPLVDDGAVHEVVVGLAPAAVAGNNRQERD